MKTFQLSIVVSSDEFFNYEAVSVSVPGVAGQLGVLANHLPLMAQLKLGLVHVVHMEGENKLEKWFGVTGGFFEMMGDHATILADEIIRPWDEAEMPKYLEGKALYLRSEYPGGETQLSDMAKALLFRKLVALGLKNPVHDQQRQG